MESMASRAYQPPASFVAEAGQWPVGPLSAEAPVYATVTAHLVHRLQAVMADRGLSLRAVANPAGIDPTSLVSTCVVDIRDILLLCLSGLVSQSRQEDVDVQQ